MFQNLFNPNIEFIESTYSIQIDKKTIPTFKPGIIRQYRVNTQQIIKDVLIKKTKKNCTCSRVVNKIAMRFS